MSKINEKRSAKMRQLSVPELKKIIEAGSLSSAAASYELRKRGEIAR